jgi:hypothetical protein
LLDPLLVFSTWHREKAVGLRPALDPTRFVALRSDADPSLADQLQQLWKIRDDSFRFVQMGLLKRPVDLLG